MKVFIYPRKMCHYLMFNLNIKPISILYAIYFQYYFAIKNHLEANERLSVVWRHLATGRSQLKYLAMFPSSRLRLRRKYI